MQDHRYILEPYKPNNRHRCPGCGKNRVFTNYIDNQTGELLSLKAGRCDRESSCGYHYTPKQYFSDNGITPEPSSFIPIPKAKPLPTSFIDKDVFSKSLTGYENNNFITYLSSRFDTKTVHAAIKDYQIGTSKHWPGATTFWQIDDVNNIRTGKIMLYNSTTGKRVKEPYNHVTWAHKALKLEAFNLKQSLFGLPLLKASKKPIAIVESEKTAIIASIYLPSFTWLSCGGIKNLKKEVCDPLKGRKVILYPDLNAFEQWNEKAKELGFNISDLLETKASPEDRKQGFDLADYLMKLDIQQSEKSPLPDEVLSLQKYYSELENSRLIPDKHQDYIKNIWAGLMEAYRSKHWSVSLYTDALNKLKLEI